MKQWGWLMCVVALLLPSVAPAGEVEVVDVKVTKAGDGTYRFDVTLRHADAGWEHYADRWDVLIPDGALIGTRVLYHPHVEEQPFTRSLGGVRVPNGVGEVIVRAHDKVHGSSGKTMRVRLPD